MSPSEKIHLITDEPGPEISDSKSSVQYKVTSVSRKNFLLTAGSAVLMASFGIVIPGCSKSGDPAGGNIIGGNDPNNDSGIQISGNRVTIDLTKKDAEPLASSGGWLLITGAQTLVINVDGNVIRAFTSVCPHAGCTTNWTYGNSRFRCTCHDSIFDNTGRRVSGPATSDLREFSVTRTGNTVEITTS